MEDFFEDKEFEEHRARHAARMERMRKEKLQQAKTIKMIKQIAPLVLGLIVIILIACFGGNKDADEPDVIPTETATETVTETQTETETEIVEEGPPYKFTENDETVYIYSDKMTSQYAILVDVSTDTIVAKKGHHDKMSPASMTKVLTVLVAAEHITEEQLDDTFTITFEITDYAYANDCSVVGFLNDEKVTVRDLFYGTILPSGGDAAVGLATYVAGSHEAFVELMNEKLDELGLSGTAHFTNCVGLYDKEHYCTPYDMAIIMRAAMDNELCREVLSTKCYTTSPTEQHPEGLIISNWFLRRIEDKDTGGEVIGGKTGYVAQSRSCAVSYGTSEDGTPYICVTAGANGSWRCIYDHVEIYNNYVREPGEVIESPSAVNETPEETEATTEELVLSIADLQIAKTVSQIITVTAEGNKATLTMHEKAPDGTWSELLSTSASIGANGIGKSKEGDRKTPTGMYRFLFGFGNEPNPGTALSYTQADLSYYWVDDPDSAYYNQFVSTSKVRKDWDSAEHIAGVKDSYNYALALDYNKECTPGLGSAIFLHCTPTSGAGCIAVPENVMIEILKNITGDCVIIIDSQENMFHY